jgi:pyruvate/2-oxoglutarate dehydrogenase complex dihydrolipoamide dehydrogenase (E3) component
MTERYDVVIIGLGPGGEAAANRLLKACRRVALVERELIGGECGYWACIPSKTLLRPIELARETAATPGITAAVLDWDAARAWRDDMIRNLDDTNQVAGYEEQGATVIRGRARLAGPGQVDVGGRKLACEHILIATGSAPVIPEIAGLDEGTVWTNREVTNLSEIPERVAIVGVSAVAVEVSQYLRGTEPTSPSSAADPACWARRNGASASSPPTTSETTASSYDSKRPRYAHTATATTACWC